MLQQYGVSSRDYLQRAKRNLRAADDPSGLFYAAFELRSGVEARLQEHLEPHSHVPDRRKKDWRVPRLGKTAEKAFKLGSKVARVQFLDEGTRNVLSTHFYTPVTPELRKLAQKLGDYLHAAKLHPPGDAWWANFRTNLEIAAKLLEEATFGVLLGPPLLNKKTGRLHLPMELPHGAPKPPALEVGASTLMDIRYFDSLADARGDAA